MPSKKCPYHDMEMRFVASCVNSKDSSYEYWLCPDRGRFPRPHIIRTKDWGTSTEYQEPTWNTIIIKKEGF